MHNMAETLNGEIKKGRQRREVNLVGGVRGRFAFKSQFANSVEVGGWEGGGGGGGLK
jgi:hypothetical protein